MHKLVQVELQLDRLQLPYLEIIGSITTGGSPAHYRRRQPNISYHTKKAPTLNWRLHWGVGKQTGNMSAVPSQVESRPTTPHQEQLNQTEGANRTGVDPQPQTRVPMDNVNTFVEVLQSLQHSQQQMMEEIRQLKADKTSEKGSQHDPDNVADREETLAGGVPRNAGQRFITMAKVAVLLEQERARTPKERFYA